MPSAERTLDAALATPAGGSARGLVAPDVGAAVELPWFVVRGAEPGPTLLVTAGVHGAEYASIEAAYRAAEQSPNGLRGTLLVLPIVCPPSYAARTVYVNPVDGLNLNRVFPGRDDGTFAERLAGWLMREAVGAARESGAPYIVLVGDKPYYWPFGFETAPRGLISMPGPVDPSRLLICSLEPDVVERMGGMVRWAG